MELNKSVLWFIGLFNRTDDTFFIHFPSLEELLIENQLNKEKIQ